MHLFIRLMNEVNLFSAGHLVASNHLPEEYDLLSGWVNVQRGVFFRDGRI
jgi:hypothetical protein